LRGSSLIKAHKALFGSWSLKGTRAALWRQTRHTVRPREARETVRPAGR
jgi:hypothetical protein